MVLANKKKRTFLAATIMAVVAGLFVGVSIGGARRGNQIPTSTAALPRVLNETTALRVVGVDSQPIGTSFGTVISLQNVSSKTIKAYSIAHGNKWTTRNLFLVDEGIVPGQINQYVAMDRDEGVDYSVVAVQFEDGTTQGKPVFTFRLNEIYGGMQAQARAILPCLARLSSPKGLQTESLVADCENVANKLSVKGGTSDYSDGLKNAQAAFLAHIQDVKTKVKANNLADATGSKDRALKIAQTLTRSSQ